MELRTPKTTNLIKKSFSNIKDAEKAHNDLVEWLDFFYRMLQVDMKNANAEIVNINTSITTLNGSIPRRAKIQTVNTSDFTCKLLDSAGAETGSNITVYPTKHLGTNALSGSVWPDYAANDVISVFKDLDGNYYMNHPFDDTDECAT